MEKTDIKVKLREGFDELINNNGGLEEKIKRNPEAQKDDDVRRANNLNKQQGEGGKKDYSDVRRAFEKIGSPSMVDVMKLTGIPDDENATNRSLFSKKFKKIKNKYKGSYYQFCD